MVEETLRGHHATINYIYSPLAHSSLIKNTLMAGDVLSTDLQRIGISVLLRWGIDTLRQGSRTRQDRCWRLYFSLWNTYIVGKTFEETANTLEIALSSIYDLRSEAITQLAELLQQELVYQQGQKVRKELAIRQRYAEQHEEAQRALRLLAVFDEPLTLQQAQELLQANGFMLFPLEERQQEPIWCSTLAGLLCSFDEEAALTIHPEARPHIMRATVPEERMQWYGVAMKYYEAESRYLLAATYLQKARWYDDAVDLLWRRYTKIIDAGESLALQSIVARFQQHQVSKDHWLRLRILAGQLAFELEDAEAARLELLHVLGADNIALRVKGYYHWAETLVSVLFDAALQHYDKGIQLAQAHLPNPDLENTLVDLYIGKAWLYIQERQDFDRALSHLTKAQEYVKPSAHLQRCRLFNAWAQLKSRMGDVEGELAYRNQALEAATSSEHRREMMKTSHNLGQTYVFAKQLEMGIIYLQQGQALAAAIGNRKWEDKCRQATGAAYFWAADYERAITYYRAAYDSYVATKHENWQGFVCHDLAEAYAKLGKQKEMRAFFEEARIIAKRGRFQELHDLLDQLARTYPDIEIQLTDQQQKVLEFADQHGSITKGEYCKLTGAKDRTATRDLARLVEWGILALVGQGRGARYERVKSDT